MVLSVFYLADSLIVCETLKVEFTCALFIFLHAG